MSGGCLEKWLQTSVQLWDGFSDLEKHSQDCLVPSQLHPGVHGPKFVCILLVLFWSGYQSSSLNVVIVSVAFRRVIYLYSRDPSEALRNGNETYLRWNCQPIIDVALLSFLGTWQIPAFPPLYLF